MSIKGNPVEQATSNELLSKQAQEELDKRMETLPEEISWLSEDIRALVRPCALLSRDDRHVDAPGETRTWGEPDVPADESGRALLRALRYSQSPHDGECFWLQLNLQDIPAYGRRPAWPEVGMVWMTLDLSGRHGSGGYWRAQTYFDARPADKMVWLPRPPALSTQNDSTRRRAGRSRTPSVSRWTEELTLPCATDLTLPAIANWPAMCDIYDQWVGEKFMSRRHRYGSAAQLGGWVWPIQGDHDDAHRTVVCAMEDQSFGDCGAVYLHFEEGRGFWAEAHTR
jgi:hypothetical protein